MEVTIRKCYDVNAIKLRVTFYVSGHQEGINSRMKVMQGMAEFDSAVYDAWRNVHDASKAVLPPGKQILLSSSYTQPWFTISGGTISHQWTSGSIELETQEEVDQLIHVLSTEYNFERW